MIQRLKKVLANTHLLYVKTLNYHWNVEDGRFAMLHALFQGQYESLAGYVDEFAERIRMLGEKAPGTLKEFLELGTVSEGDSGKTADQMLADLAKSHEAAVLELREGIKEAESKGDPGTADLMIEALRDHEKAAWFLKSHL